MAVFYGRSRELGRLRALLDAAEPGLVRVVGVRGGGKSALVERVLGDYRATLHRCAPLPDPTLRAALAGRIRAEASEGGADDGPSDDASWTDILGHLAEVARAEGRARVLVLDDAHRLDEARSRIAPALSALAARWQEGTPPVHVVCVGAEAGLPDDDAVAPLRAETLRVDPLPFRAALPLLPGGRPRDLALAYGTFGGIPRVLTALDPSVTVGTNVRRLVLEPEGALADVGAAWLERDLQSPARYYAILAALARGEADWGTIQQGVVELETSGQVAPYLARLDRLGLVERRRSLDAKPTSRSTRYALTDPFLLFWFRFVLPYRYAAEGEDPSAYYGRAVRPAMDDHMARVFPEMCRQHLSFDAIETLGANAREAGSLWGSGYDLPVAGLLTSGAACYGTCAWTTPTPEDPPLERVERAVRETRYGFGRERRTRIVFTGEEPPAWLRREVARHRDAAVIDLEELVGG